MKKIIRTHYESIVKRKEKDKLEEKDEIPRSPIYKTFLEVELAIKKSGIDFWIGGVNSPSAWQEMRANIISYNVFHSNDSGNSIRKFGKEYLDNALKQHDLVCKHYTLAFREHKELQRNLDALGISINQEIQKCNQKLQNNTGS